MKRNSRFTAIGRIFVSGLLSAALMGVGPAAQSFPAVLELTDLDGSNGFTFNGTGFFPFVGRSVSSAGDINGDGIDDIIIGASGVDTNGGESGATYVVFGSDQGFPASLQPDDLDGGNGFVVNGVSGQEQSGVSVSKAGDMNGDGFDDVLIGAPGGPNGSFIGAGYVLFGGDKAFPASIELADLDETSGFVVNGVAPSDRTGEAVSGVGDVNADGIDDIIIGAWFADPNDKESAGASYVIFGRDANQGIGFAGPLDVSQLDGSDGFVVNGITAGDKLGHSVSGVGDVNADGIADFIIGGSSAGAYVIFGDNQGFPANFDLADLDGMNGFSLDAAVWVSSVSGAGDVNGDGLDDLIIGAANSEPGETGSSFVVFGSDEAFPVNLNLADLNGTNGFVVKGLPTDDDNLLAAVSGAGDVNGDGLDDLVIGAPLAAPNGEHSGSSYVVFGRESFPAMLDIIDLNGNDGFVMNGLIAGDQFGRQVNRAGDVNGDGVDDLIIGAPHAVAGSSSSPGQGPGASYVVFGERTDNTPPVITPSITGALGTSGWYTSDVTVSWDLVDMESEIVSTQSCDTATLTTDTAGQTFTCKATSAGGTSQQSVTIKRDATKPYVTLTNPADGARFTLGEEVLAEWGVADDLSGIAVSQATVANGAPIDTATGGSKRFEVVAIDAAGNQTTVTDVYTVETMSTVSELIAELITDVQALGLPRGIENRLVRQLQRADRDFNRGREFRAWRRVLFFAFRVARLSGWRIAPADANALIDSACDVLGAIRTS